MRIFKLGKYIYSSFFKINVVKLFFFSNKYNKTIYSRLQMYFPVVEYATAVMFIISSFNRYNICSLTRSTAIDGETTILLVLHRYN